MPTTLAAVTVTCAVLYFRRTGEATVREGAGLGSLWLAMSVVVDLPLMLSPPLNYSPAEYVADVGLTYMMIPVITVGIAVAADAKSREMARSKQESRTSR